MMKNWRWFISKRLREAVEDRKQIIKLLAAQRDLIKSAKIDELEQALSELDEQCRGPIDKEALLDARKNALDSADRVLIPYRDAGWRDWVEMFLVVAALVLAFRTFFFQPFKIPTGSMQPTLYGITIENLMDRVSGNIKGRVDEGILTATDAFFHSTDVGRTILFDDESSATITRFLSGDRVEVDLKTNIEQQQFTVTFELPNKKRYAVEKLRGYSYHSMQAEGNWKLENIEELRKIIPFISKQILVFRDIDSNEIIRRTVWYPPLNSYQKPILAMGYKDDHEQPFIHSQFARNEFIFKLRVKTGDHLFVNRLTYNFRHPRRGDISVFTIKSADATHGHSGLPNNDTFYIKRLVGLGGENVTIGPDRHLRINDRRLSSIDRGFEFVYSHPKDSNRMPLNPAIKSVYSGHELVNDFHYRGPDLSNSKSPYKVPKNHLIFFGDNTANSMDSRSWGALPKKNVIGHSSFVYWPPLSPRFGWSHR